MIVQMDIMYIRRAMGGFYLYLCCVIAMTIFGRRYHHYRLLASTF